MKWGGEGSVLALNDNIDMLAFVTSTLVSPPVAPGDHITRSRPQFGTHQDAGLCHSSVKVGEKRHVLQYLPSLEEPGTRPW